GGHRNVFCCNCFHTNTSVSARSRMYCGAAAEGDSFPPLEPLSVAPEGAAGVGAWWRRDREGFLGPPFFLPKGAPMMMSIIRIEIAAGLPFGRAATRRCG